MWVKAALALFGMGQENTIRNQEFQAHQNSQLANILFRDRQTNEQAIVIISMMLVIGTIFFIIARK